MRETFPHRSFLTSALRPALSWRFLESSRSTLVANAFFLPKISLRTVLNFLCVAVRSKPSPLWSEMSILRVRGGWKGVSSSPRRAPAAFVLFSCEILSLGSARVERFPNRCLSSSNGLLTVAVDERNPPTRGQRNARWGEEKLLTSSSLSFWWSPPSVSTSSSKRSSWRRMTGWRTAVAFYFGVFLQILFLQIGNHVEGVLFRLTHLVA